MKLWQSFTKEVLLASRSMYFYVEILMAVIFLVLLLFIVPEHAVTKTHEYLYYDVPDAARSTFIAIMLEADEDHQVETVDFKWNGNPIQAALYESEDAKLFVFDDRDAAIGLADKNLKFAAIVHMDAMGNVTYTYYMQGYETERLRNTYAVLHNETSAALRSAIDAQTVEVLHTGRILLNDRENMIPTFLTFNGSLMGMFILAAYVFLDKKEGVINAYAITPSPIWHYLLSKVAVVTLTSLVTSLLITIPVMGLQPNYAALIIFLLTTGFTASSLGLLLTSFYRDIMQSFGVLFTIIILMMIPNIAYFLPTWDPGWVKVIPTYAVLQGFKETILINGDISYVGVASLAFLIVGVLIFLFANMRFKKTLTL